MGSSRERRSVTSHQSMASKGQSQVNHKQFNDLNLNVDTRLVSDVDVITFMFSFCLDLCWDLWNRIACKPYDITMDPWLYHMVYMRFYSTNPYTDLSSFRPG